MGRLSFLFKLFKIIPIIATDIARYSGDKFISIHEILNMVSDILGAFGGSHLYIKVSFGGEKKIIGISELISMIEQLIGDVIDLDRSGIQIMQNGVIHFVLKPSTSKA